MFQLLISVYFWRPKNIQELNTSYDVRHFNLRISKEIPSVDWKHWANYGTKCKKIGHMWQCLYKILEISSKLWKNASQIYLMNWNIRVFNVPSDTGQWAARKKIAVPATA